MATNKKKSTLCWECKNFSKCSWSMGIPVEGWTAEPTKIKNRLDNNTVYYTDSFIVEKCPQYEHDKYYRMTLDEINEKYPISSTITPRSIYCGGIDEELYNKHKIRIKNFDSLYYVEVCE